eukprot:487699-Amphidinium_carterae.2
MSHGAHGAPHAKCSQRALLYCLEHVVGPQTVAKQRPLVEQGIGNAQYYSKQIVENLGFFDESWLEVVMSDQLECI